MLNKIKSFGLIRGFLFGVCCIGVSFVHAASYYVSVTGDDDHSGTSESEAFKTLAKAVATAGYGERVVILPGQHLVPYGVGKNGFISIRGATGRPEDVVLYGSGTNEILRLANGASVYDLTISNGVRQAVGGDASVAGGIRIGGTYDQSKVLSCVVSNCVITHCVSESVAQNCGGGVALYTGGVLIDSRVTDCVSRRGGGVFFRGDHSEVRNCIIENNTATESGGGIYSYMSLAVATQNSNTDTRVIGSIVRGNTAPSCGGIFNASYIENSVISNNVATTGALGSGGCIFLQGVDAVLTNSTISGNRTETSFGGGITVTNATLLVSDCEISDNVTAGASGGGFVVLQEGVLTMSDSQILRNVANSNGGGLLTKMPIRLDRCVFTDNVSLNGNGGGLVITQSPSATNFVTDCRFTGNTAQNGGGVMVYEDHRIVLDRCAFLSNHASAGTGGAFSGVQNKNFYGSMTSCIVTGNTAVTYGGGFYMRDVQTDKNGEPFIIRNSLFAKNGLSGSASPSQGGGLYFVSGRSSVLDSCTVADNFVQEKGAGVYHKWNGYMTNCVISGNLIVDKPETGGTWTLNAANYTSCCVWPALPSIFLAERGCVNKDPLFVDAASGDYTPGTGSPCRDAGILEDWMTEDAKDVAGQVRVYGSRPDIGAFERRLPPGVLFLFR